MCKFPCPMYKFPCPMCKFPRSNVQTPLGPKPFQAGLREPQWTQKRGNMGSRTNCSGGCLSVGLETQADFHEASFFALTRCLLLVPGQHEVSSDVLVRETTNTMRQFAQDSPCTPITRRLLLVPRSARNAHRQRSGSYSARRIPHVL